MTIPITVETLATVRALTAWVLLRERATQSGSHAPSAPEALRQQLVALPLEMLIQAIQRHRLESMFYADPAVGDLVPNLGDEYCEQHAAKQWLRWPLPVSLRDGLIRRSGHPFIGRKGILWHCDNWITHRGPRGCDLCGSIPGG